MGDLCDQADIDRILRSKEGKAHLRQIRRMLKGKTVVDVTYTNETCCIATTLRLDDDTSFVLFQPSLTVEALREQFPEVLEREYYRDFPERRPHRSDRA